jgi:hypothetical protein
MKVKIRQGKKFVIVDVNYRDCPKLSCFYYGHYTHHTSCGMSGCSSRTDEELSCLRRDNHGCPESHK